MYFNYEAFCELVRKSDGDGLYAIYSTISWITTSANHLICGKIKLDKTDYSDEIFEGTNKFEIDKKTVEAELTSIGRDLSLFNSLAKQFGIEPVFTGNKNNTSDIINATSEMVFNLMQFKLND